MVEFIFENGEDSITLPLNPENIEIQSDAPNEKPEVVGLGQIVVPRTPNLKTFSINGVFPSFLNDNELAPGQKLQFLENAYYGKKTLRLVITGLDLEPMLIVIDSLDFERKAGIHEDIHYSISFCEYRSFGAKEIIVDEETNTIPPESPEREDLQPPQGNTHEVRSGDSLYKITRKFTGNGNRWRELYDLNVDVVGSNPSMIRIGTILQIPESWV